MTGSLARQDGGEKMIVQIRIDDRLVHGQVALVWSKELNTTRIIVANKHAVESDALRMTLQMGTPVGQKLIVKDVPGACKLATTRGLRTCESSHSPTASKTHSSWSREPLAKWRAST